MPPPDDPRSDQQLIDALNGGDLSAFDAIYYRYRDWVMGLSFRFTRNHEDCLDVLQETFSYLSRKFPGFVLTATMTTFLYPVVKNLSLEIVRKRRGMITSDEVLLDLPSRELNKSSNSRDVLAEVLKQIPAAAREVLLLRFVDGLSLAEIAVALSVPLGTVKSRLHNALQSLRDDERTRRYFER